MTQDVAAYMNEATTVAWEIDGLASGTNLRDVKSVGVIGAGTMGGGISMNFASIGIPVLIIETQQDALDRGLGIIQKNYQRSADRGRFPQEEVANRMANISGRPQLMRFNHRSGVRRFGVKEIHFCPFG